MFEAIILAIIEGLTEFIPVSSTGHLIAAGAWLNFDAVPAFVYEIVIQLGAILAVCVVYWQRLWRVATGMWHHAPAQCFVRNIVLAFLPAALFGALLHSWIKSVLFTPLVVAVMLIVGGVIILLVERLVKRVKITNIEAISAPTALKIGLFQCVAMIPGTSRSGATIMGALLLGLDRKTATEFSFFLAIPTMLGAVVFDLYKNHTLLSAEHVHLLIIGFIVAFLAALLVVKTVLHFITRHGFTPFAWYRIGLGILLLTALAIGWL